jgi:eukaryotic-like serine/threonine-protein kinase
MQCPKCQSPIEAGVGGGAPSTCPRCGASISPEIVPRSGSRGLLVPIFVSLVLMATITLSVGSTIVALRTGRERDLAREDFARSARAFDDVVAAVASNSKLKGPALEPTRKELLQPALDYYRTFVQSRAADPKMLPERVSAQFHMAALYVKLGSKDGVSSLTQGIADLNQLKDSDLDPETFPSLQACALKVASPIDWVMVKGVDQAYALSLVLAISRAIDTYQGLSQKYPQVVSFRDDFSALLKASAMLQAQRPERRQEALGSWLKARDALETLVRDRPANLDYQTRLAESLTTAARMQKTAGETDKAADNLQRAVALREQMAAAHPDDNGLKQELTIVKRDLEKLKPAADKDAAAAVAPQ